MDTLGAPRALGFSIDPFSIDARKRGPVSYGRKPETQAAAMRSIIAEHAAIRERIALSPHEPDHKRTWRAPTLGADADRMKDRINDWSCKKHPTRTEKKNGGSGKKWVPWCK